MYTTTASTTQNETFSKTPTEGLLAKIRKLKGLPALAAFGALLVVCVLLVVALLVYLYSGKDDSGPAVASAPSLTPDKEYDTTPDSGANSSETSTMTSRKVVSLNDSVTVKPSGLHSASGRIYSASGHMYRALLPGRPASNSASPSDSNSAMLLNESIQRSGTSASNNNAAAVAEQDVAHVNGSKPHLRPKVTMLMVGLDGSGDAFPPFSLKVARSSASSDSSNDCSTIITIADRSAPKHGSRDEPLPVQVVTDDYTAVGHPQANTAPAEKSTLFSYTASPSAVSIKPYARTDAVISTAERQPSHRFQQTGSRGRAPADNIVPDQKYAIFLDKSKPEDQFEDVAPIEIGE